MHICCIATTSRISSDRNEGIGSSTHIYELGQSFVKLGHNVTICAERSSKSDATHEYFSGFSVVRLSRHIPYRLRKNPSVFIRFFRPLKILSIVLLSIKIARAIRNQSVDVILERSQSLGVGALVSLILHKPLFVEVIDDQYAFLSFLLARRIFVYTIDIIPKMFTGKCTIVFAGVNADIFRPHKSAKKYDIGFVGSWKSWEGIEDLLHALTVLKNRTAILIGEGQLTPMIIAETKRLRLEDRVTFSGKVGIDRVASLLSQAVIGVAPYNISYARTGRFERFGFYFSPLKVVEYLACGLPVVASDYPRIRDIIVPPTYGYVYEPGNPQTFARAIDRAIKRKWNRASIRARAFAFSWDALANTMLMQIDR